MFEKNENLANVSYGNWEKLEENFLNFNENLKNLKKIWGNIEEVSYETRGNPEKNPSLNRFERNSGKGYFVQNLNIIAYHI